MKEWIEKHKTKVMVILVSIIVAFFYFANRSSVQDDMVIGDSTFPVKQDHMKEEEKIQEVKQVIIMVDVKGEVKVPGVYEAQEGERVNDLINKAGGFTQNADQNQVNLSEHVKDEMVIYAPPKGEVMSSNENHVLNQKSKLINLNMASENELQTLPGIGPSKALSIIEYRETNGGFQTIEDLKKISGIGEKTFEKLAPLISVK